MDLQRLENICHSFGGRTFSAKWKEDWGKGGHFCHMDGFDFITKTDGNTCVELQGEDRQKTCRFPIENTILLRERKHPKYFDDPSDQLIYSLLVEESQAFALREQEELKEDPDAEKKRLDIFKKHPIGSIGLVTGITKDEKGKPKVETVKIKDLYVKEELARRFWQSFDTFLIEQEVKDRYAHKIYHKYYFDLPSNEQAKIRYRINKHTKDFKL